VEEFHLATLAYSMAVRALSCGIPAIAA